MADGQPGNLLGERLTPTVSRVTEEPAYPQVHDQLPPTHRNVDKPPLVPAVHPSGLDPTARARRRRGPDPRMDTHDSTGRHDPLDDESGQVRKQDIDEVTVGHPS